MLFYTYKFITSSIIVFSLNMKKLRVMHFKYFQGQITNTGKSRVGI